MIFVPPSVSYSCEGQQVTWPGYIIEPHLFGYQTGPRVTM